MKKIVRLTESDMVRLIRKVISEQYPTIPPTPSDNTQVAVNKPMKNEKYYTYSTPYPPNFCEMNLEKQGVKVPKEGYNHEKLKNYDDFMILRKKVMEMMNTSKNENEKRALSRYIMCTVNLITPNPKK